LEVAEVEKCLNLKKTEFIITASFFATCWYVL